MADYLNETLSHFIGDAAAGQPTPGGGSVAALTGALASTMASMAGNFTVGREKYRSVEPQVHADLERLKAARGKLLDLMHRDMQAYGGVSTAYKLPKETAADKAARREAIAKALRQAMHVPMEVGGVAIEVLEASESLAMTANPNLLSDVAVAAILAEAAWRAARVNVEVNLDGLGDSEETAEVRRRLDADERVARERMESCLKAIADRRA